MADSKVSNLSAVTAFLNADYAYVARSLASKGMTYANFLKQVGQYNAWAYGLAGDGVADDYAGFQAFLNAIPNAGYPAFLPGGIYRITAGLTIGDGTSTTFSSKNNLALLGLGAAAGSNTAPGDSTKAPVVIKYDGVAAGTILTVNGPMSGVRIENIVFNCNSLASQALLLNHPDKSIFRNLEIVKNAGYGISIFAYDGNDATANGANNNSFENINITSSEAACGGLSVGNASRTDILDVAQCHFNNLRIRFDGGTGATGATVGIRLRYCDFLTFTNTLVSVNAGGTSLSIVPPTGATPAEKFPNNIVFTHCSLGALGTNIAGTAASNEHRIFFIGYSTGDTEPIPTPTMNYAAGFDTTGGWFGFMKNDPLKYSLIADSAAIHTTTEPTAFNKAYTLPANILSMAGTVVRVRAAGVYSTTGTPTLNLAIYIGTIFLTNVLITGANNAANYGWSAVGEATVRVSGAGGSLQVGPGFNGLVGGTPGATASNDGAATAINTTATQAVQVVATWSASSASNTCKMTHLAVEVLYPGTTGS